MKKITGLLAVIVMLAGFVSLGFAEGTNTAAVDTAKPAAQAVKSEVSKGKKAVVKKHKAARKQAKSAKKAEAVQAAEGVVKEGAAK